MNRGKRNTLLSVVIAFHLAMIGCAAKRVTSDWYAQPITADGSESEWPEIPQYYDKDRQTSIRLMNDADSIYICFVTNDNDLKRNLAMAGLSVWFDPEGEENRVVGIHIPGGRRTFFPNFSKSHEKHDSREPKPQLLKTPEKLEITYSKTTGPLEMSMEEVQRTGIEIAAGQPNGSRFVYEFVIPFEIDDVFSELGPDNILGMGVSSGNTERTDKESTKPSMGTMGGHNGRRGGRGQYGKNAGMSRNVGGTNQSGYGKSRPEPFEVWMKVKMAGT